MCAHMPADARRDPEDIYELSPLQEGMLYHVLRAPGSGLYCEQLSADLAGAVDAAAFALAWQRVADRHPALRTSFQWEGLAKPLQVVLRRAPVPVEFHDWTGDGPGAEARLEEFAAAERVRDFDLAQAPLMRVAVIRLGAERHRVIWTHSHLLIDGWCLPRLLGDLTEAYAALTGGREPRFGPVRPYRDFIVWLRGRDEAAARVFWAQALRGFDEPTPLPASGAGSGGADRAGECAVEFSEEETARLADWCRQERITVSTLCQGAWALALGRLTGREDVVFGTTVAGRPADLAGAEDMIGLFIQTLPARAILEPAAPAAEWLRAFQRAQAAARAFEHTPLVRIRAASALPPGADLFATLFAFENYPMAAAADGPLRLAQVRVTERTNYPLTIAAALVGGRLAARVLYDGARLGRPAAAAAGRRLRAAVLALAAGAGRRLGEIDLLTPGERDHLRTWGHWAADTPAEAAGHWLARFARQAAGHPAAPALVSGTQVIPYGELARRVDVFAERLRARGAGPE